ncbi:MAG: hydrogen peroxide-inducible genes activator [Rhodospirillaceae bacterium]
MVVHLPTLRQLQYLTALADELHFSRAADRCHVTQSTLSAGLQELETILGAALVERTKRRVRMTPLGEDFVARARRILTEVEDMAVMATAGKEPLAGLLRMGAIPTIGPYVLPRIMGPLRASYPDLRLFLREDKTPDLIAALDGGAIDAALIALPVDVAGLDFVTLADDPFWYAARPDHPLAGGRAPLNPEDLPTDDLILLDDGHCLRDQVLAICPDRRQAARPGAFQATSLYTLVELVAGGFGTTLLPEIALKSELLQGAAISVRPLAGKVGRKIALTWRRNSPRRAEYRLLAQFLRNGLAKSAAD